MSLWTYVSGQIIVAPIGRTQHEKEYVLKTVLDHLPLVTSSESDMEVYVTQVSQIDTSSSHDEFSMRTDKAKAYGGYRSRKGMFRVSSYYILSIYGQLRDRTFEETQKEFIKWLCRLAKRCFVDDIVVKVSGYSCKLGKKRKWIETNSSLYRTMYEYPSWCEEGTVNWCEYLMWDAAKDSSVPLAHSHKYGWDEEDTKEFLRRKEYEFGN